MTAFELQPQPAVSWLAELERAKMGNRETGTICFFCLELKGVIFKSQGQHFVSDSDELDVNSRVFPHQSEQNSNAVTSQASHSWGQISKVLVKINPRVIFLNYRRLWGFVRPLSAAQLKMINSTFGAQCLSWAQIEFWCKRVRRQLCTLWDTHTSFSETCYLLSHTPQPPSNLPWWRLIAAFKACWAPPVKAADPRAALVCAWERKDCPGARSIMKVHDRLDLWSRPPHLDHRHGAIRPGWQAHWVNPPAADLIAASLGGWEGGGSVGCEMATDVRGLRKWVCGFDCWKKSSTTPPKEYLKYLRYSRWLI